MNSSTETPFDSIESSHQYIALLFEALAEAQVDVEAAIEVAEAERATRRREALRIVALKLNKLSTHITASRSILNDLRTLHRLLVEERRPAEPAIRTDREPGNRQYTSR